MIAPVTTPTRADPYTPRLFEHDLDPALFTSERLDDLVRRADARGHLGVQWADPGRQRYGNGPIHTTPHYPVLEDTRRRPVQYRLYEVDRWAGPEYVESQRRVLDDHAPDIAGGPVIVEPVIRVFAPGAVVALHGDPDLKLVCTIAGETVWWVRPTDDMTQTQHENLLRGEFFLPWTESERDQPLRIPAGHGCFVPARWAHWLEHPGDEPVVSFELGFWSVESVHQRKVYDVNWLLRRLHVDPKGFGEGRDHLKRTTFDAISLLTRKGGRFRGI
jgi:hypothetical protein